MTRRLVVEPGAASTRLDVYLASALERSRTYAGGVIRDGDVSVNGRTARPSLELEPGDVVEVVEVAPVRQTPSPPAPQLPVIYQDDDLLVIDKPAGVAVHSGTRQGVAGTVADFARLHSSDTDPERPGIVHRLDKDTSGLLVLARTPEAKKALQKLFHDHKIDKTYRLLAVGRVQPEAAVIDLPTDRDPARPTRRAIVAAGRPSTTKYETLASYSGYSYIQASPKTGRTHQIRVHFASLGHPVAGDVIYGPSQRPLGLKRQFLHAARLKFTTPTGKELDLSSPLPTDLQAVLARLDQENA